MPIYPLKLNLNKSSVEFFTLSLRKNVYIFIYLVTKIYALSQELVFLFYHPSKPDTAEERKL